MIVVGAFCLVAAAMGLPAIVHLSKHAHIEKHDQGHCPICLACLAFQKCVFIEYEQPIYSQQISGRSVVYDSPACVYPQLTPLPQSPRAPPGTS